MAKQFQLQFQLVFLFMVLVMASLPALQDSWRKLQVQAISPAPAPGPQTSYWGAAPGSSASPAPQVQPPQVPPTPPGGGGGGAGGGGGSGGGGSGGSGGSGKGGGGGSSGLSGGQKAGIVIGVLLGAGLIGFATVVYMKRRSNIRRARFGVLARRSEL